MTAKVLPYCRPIIASYYRGVPVDRATACQNLVELLQTRQIVVVSGRDQQQFSRNTQNGKSSLFSDEPWLAHVQKHGLSFYHHNFHHSMRIDIDVANIPKADVYIFDEIHLFMPRLSGSMDPRSYMAFWEKVGELMARNKKLIFVTALHPQNMLYQADLCFESEDGYDSMGEFFAQYKNTAGFRAIVNFFFAPVLELPAREF